MSASAAPAAVPPLAAGRRALLLASAGLLGRPVSARATTAAGRIVLAGNGGAVGAMRLLAAAHLARHPGVEFEFLPSLGTSGGIAAAIAGVVDLAMAARPVNDREAAQGARSLAYGRTPLAFAVHGALPVRDVAMADVVRILAGDLAAWPDGTRIRPIRRPHNDGMTTTLAAVSPAMAQAMDRFQRRPGMLTAGNDHDNAEALETVQGSFGAITLAQVLTEQRRVVLLTLDGVPADPPSLAAGRYPVVVTLFGVTRGDPAPATADFLAFVRGPEGQAILAASGHAPVAGPGTA